MVSKLSLSFIIRYTLFILLGAVTTLAIIKQKPILIVVLISLIIVLYLLHRKSVRIVKESCDLMLEAIKNNDYSFRMPIGSIDNMMKPLNKTINRFGQLLSETQKRIRENEIFYEKVLASVSTGIIVLDQANKVVLSNKAASDLLDVPPISSLYQLGRYGEEMTKNLTEIKQNERRKIEFKTSKGISTIIATCTTTDLNLKPVRIIALSNIKKEMEQKEIESWTKLTRVMTHEIMNSIAPIASISDTFMNREDVINTPIYTGIKAIHETSKGLIDFVNSYRKLSYLQKATPQPFELREILQQIEGLNIIPKHIQFTKQILPHNLMLFADQNLIRQVMINLIKNAVEAIENKKGKIELKAYVRRDEHIIIYISNNGTPIPNELAKEIFIPFFTTKKEGNGIGLSLSKQIMAISNGDITLLQDPLIGFNTSFMLEFE
ncbi:sensor histidine kinase [Falsiporphyromonas endometrii]|uniref:histidine kinase n=1 Tax=Falsiporphyromonas endometrii TaxID=1387297 RepID=A0ABV9K8F6_9PORP